MRFVLAPDSFKESMSAKKAALAMRKGIHAVFPHAECVMVPMADGGEGTMEALVNITNGQVIRTEVIGPLGRKVTAMYGLSGDGQTAIIEMASASGIQLTRREERNPMIATTYGTGELMKHALDKGVTHIVMGIGGSATNDGGMGMLQALGVSFQDSDGKELPYGGGALSKLHTIQMSGLDKRLCNVKIEVACDVTNPLIGENGASYIFGPQKGATPQMVQQLDESLSHFSNVIRRELRRDISQMEGAGAAGGLGGGLVAFLNAELKKGIDLIIEQTRLEENIIGANYVFTGEGSIDAQTLFGKTPYGVAALANKHGVPVIAFAGRVGNDVQRLYEHGFTAIVGILKEVVSLEDALALGEDNLAYAVENICRLLKRSHSS